MFPAIKLHSQLVDAIDRLGFHEATAVQQRVVPIAMHGRDLMVSAKTGSGKTLAFLLPSLHKLLVNDKPSLAPRLLILLPTRELAEQTLLRCEDLISLTELTAIQIIGGEDFKQQYNKLVKNPDIIIATPGRLVEHLENQSMSLSAVEIFILDEADRMLEMGFSEDLLKISQACQNKRQNLLFSATLKNNTLRSISDNLLHNPQTITIDSRRSSPDNIDHQVILADDVKHKQALVAALANDEDFQHLMVFCNTRTQCRQLGNFLLYKKIKADFLHGDIPQTKRREVLESFRDGYTQVLVATDVASRGLDIEELDLVINFESPFSAEDYLHRCGRTGRAGRQGTAITLISAAEWNLMYSIERYLRMKFDKIQLSGLVANYSGPKKLKKSGKAVGLKKKKHNKKTAKKKSSSTLKKRTRAKTKKLRT